MGPTTVECLIIGGGPAGLTAATYLGRFRRTAVLVDAGNSRASRIPTTHNLIGFTNGIGGSELLDRMRAQADKYGVKREAGRIHTLDRLDDGRFAARCGALNIIANLVLLATGGLDVEPELPNIWEAVQNGLVRYCPVCDAFEAKGRRIALISYGKCRTKEALLLRGYTSDLTIMTLGREMNLTHREASILSDAGISILRDPIVRFSREKNAVAAWAEHEGGPYNFDILYSALGTHFHSELGVSLGAEVDEDGALIVDNHQKTTVEGLYAAGDVVRGKSVV